MLYLIRLLLNILATQDIKTLELIILTPVIFAKDKPTNLTVINACKLIQFSKLKCMI